MARSLLGGRWLDSAVAARLYGSPSAEPVPPARRRASAYTDTVTGYRHRHCHCWGATLPLDVIEVSDDHGRRIHPEREPARAGDELRKLFRTILLVQLVTGNRGLAFGVDDSTIVVDDLDDF